jgi:hypothetical protein
VIFLEKCRQLCCIDISDYRVQVSQATHGMVDKPWPAQLNKVVWEKRNKKKSLVLSIGQVVPHEGNYREFEFANCLSANEATTNNLIVRSSSTGHGKF